MIKALIIDDEPSAINTLHLLLQRYAPEVAPIEKAQSVEAALQLFQSFKPQLVFLDIQMPVMSGMQLLKQISPIPFEIVFTTAFDNYAIQALRFSALDNLLKPIDADELRATIDRYIQKHLNGQNHQSIYDNFLHNIDSDKKNFRLALSNTQGTFFISTPDIIRLEGEGNYTKFFLINKKTILISKTLREYEEILEGHGFIRTHKSHLINMLHIHSFNNDMLSMKDNSTVEVSRRRKTIVIDCIKNSLRESNEAN